MSREIKFRGYSNIANKMLYEIEIRYDGFILAEINSKPELVGIQPSFPMGNILKQHHPYYEGEDLKLMQYTGLKDKTGVEIYEGDILEVVEMHDKDEENWHIDDNGNIFSKFVWCDCSHCFELEAGEHVQVAWMDDRFRLFPTSINVNKVCACSESWPGLYSNNHEIDIGYYTKVIGNIHEHPELIEKK